MSVARVAHLPAPGWACAECGEDYPCQAAREMLAAEPDRRAVAVYLAALFIDAVRELPDRPVTDLYARFFRVVRRDRLTAVRHDPWVPAGGRPR
ncbi:hypothetical protein [Plantactinospora sp. KBS50]|uniref:hypothetical protein n=1 Tax=Plantactinospora sp. KBS50 TaxID=2024580 RepID=UPI001E498427|nr:hypothetical protein [Plantactinospora sp. KBS50]